MKKLPEIIHENQMIPPKNPEEGILYIAHYGFKTKLLPVLIKFHPYLNKHELSSFEIRTNGCYTHISSNPYKIEESISEELYNWMEKYRITASGDFDFLIKKWTEKLWFNTKGKLISGNKIVCPGTLSANKKPWINIYDKGHIEGKNFLVEILEIIEIKNKIKLKISGEFGEFPILFIGWFPLKYINPNTMSDYNMS